MSVTVSHVSGTSTGSTELWGHDSHSHSVPNSDYEVPSFAEHKALESRVADLSGDLSKLEQRFAGFQQKLKNDESQLQEVRNQYASLLSKIENVIREIRDTGCIATAFKGITDSHLGSIQKAVDAFSLKVREAEKTLATITSTVSTVSTLSTSVSKFSAEFNGLRDEYRRGELALRNALKKAQEEASCKLKEMEQQYSRCVLECSEAISGARYFRSVNRTFFSRLWWCLTGRCNERGTNK